MLDSELLKKLEYLSLVARKAFTGRSMAGHRNALLGGGVEFADYRNYVYGDDLRHLDWNVYARLGSSLVKRFREEGDLHVYCCLDASRSMGADVGATKFGYAKQVLAVLAYISLSRFDTVSAISFARHFETQYPPVKGKQHFSALMKYLDDLQLVGGNTDFDSFADDLLRRVGTPGLVLIASDCYDRKGLDRTLDRLLYRKFEPIVLQIYTPDEAEPDLRGDFRLTEAETGTTKRVTIDESFRRKYKRCFAQFLESVQSCCRKRGCSCYAVSTDVPFDRFVLETTRSMGSVRS